MPTVNLREAVKIFDVSRPTLQKSLRSGKIKGEQDDRKQWQIDTAELARIYPARRSEAVRANRDDSGEQSSEIRILQDRIQALEKALSDTEKRAEIAEALAWERADRIEDLRRMLPAPDPPRPRKGWVPWARLR